MSATRYQCAKCGAGELEPLGDGRKAMCVYCNTVMVLPTLNPEAFNQANALRLRQDFDQAEMAFQRIVSENPEDSESYWNLVLSRYGIEYVEDRDGTRVPTCHRMSYQSILDDPDYQKALQYADGFSYRMYQDDAAKIDRILKRAAQIAQTQPAYDIFISYKETDENKHRTEDSVIAQNVYDALKEKHPELKIFLSRITLKETAAGLEYEPIIFSALNTAKIMILVGTSRDNLEGTWVKNEWSRYRKMMDKDKNKKMAIVYKGMNPGKDFPKELRLFSIQATEAAGFYLQDFVTGIEDLLGIKKNVPVIDTARIYQTGSSRQVSNLLIRAEQALELGRDSEARGFYEKALEMQADSAGAWFGLFRLATKDLTFIDDSSSFYLSGEAKNNWQMVDRYAEGAERQEFTRKYEAYKEKWNAARQVRLDREDKAAKRKRVEDGIQTLKSETENGINFAKYHTYKRDSKFVQGLLAIAEPDKKQVLETFCDKYEKNHDVFVQLQDFKATNPVRAIEDEPKCRELREERDKAEKTMSKANSHRGGITFFNIFWAVLITAATWFFGRAQMSGLLQITYHVIPLLVCLLVSSTLMLILKKKSLDLNSGLANELDASLWGLLITIIAYFVIQFIVVSFAKRYMPELTYSTMFVGIFYLVLLAVAIGFIVLIFVNLIGAIIFIAVAGAILEWLEDALSIGLINDSVLELIQAPLFGILLAACIVTLVYRIPKWLSCRTAQSVYMSKKQLFDERDKAYQAYKNEKLDEIRKPYRGHVADSYLTDMSKRD